MVHSPSLSHTLQFTNCQDLYEGRTLRSAKTRRANKDCFALLRTLEISVSFVPSESQPFFQVNCRIVSTALIVPEYHIVDTIIRRRRGVVLMWHSGVLLVAIAWSVCAIFDCF
jgi:hypothetical protein